MVSDMYALCNVHSIQLAVDLYASHCCHPVVCFMSAVGAIVGCTPQALAFLRSTA